MIRRTAIFGFILALAAGTCVLRAQVRGGVDFTRPGRGRVRLQAPSDGLRRNSRGLGAVRGASPSGTGTALQSSLRSNLSASRGLLRRGGGTGSGLDLGTDLLGTRPEGKTLYSGFADVPPLLAGAASDLMPGKLPSLRQGLGPAAKDTGMSSRLGTLAAAFAYVQAVDVASESLGYGDEPIGTLVPDNEGLVRDRVEAGEAALQSGNFREAVDQFEMAQQLAPRSPEVLLNLVHAHFGRSSSAYVMAAHYVRRAMEHSWRLPLAPLRPREFFGREAVFVNRLMALEEHVRLNPGDADAQLVLAYFRWFQEEPDVEKVRTALRQALLTALDSEDERAASAITAFWDGVRATGRAEQPLLEEEAEPGEEPAAEPEEPEDVPAPRPDEETEAADTPEDDTDIP